jgi:hypothetical protein
MHKSKGKKCLFGFSFVCWNVISGTWFSAMDCFVLLHVVELLIVISINIYCCLIYFWFDFGCVWNLFCLLHVVEFLLLFLIDCCSHLVLFIFELIGGCIYNLFCWLHACCWINWLFLVFITFVFFCIWIGCLCILYLVLFISLFSLIVQDPNVFASASLDRSIKVWSLGSTEPNFTLEGHEKGVNCIA